MIAIVYHAKNPNFGIGETPSFQDGYDLVTELELPQMADSLALETVFMLTNHIDRSWTQNLEIKRLYGKQFRSTSVGDMVEVNGNRYLCGNVGWVKL